MSYSAAAVVAMDLLRDADISPTASTTADEAAQRIPRFISRTLETASRLHRVTSCEPLFGRDDWRARHCNRFSTAVPHLRTPSPYQGAGVGLVLEDGRDLGLRPAAGRSHASAVGLTCLGHLGDDSTRIQPYCGLSTTGPFQAPFIYQLNDRCFPWVDYQPLVLERVAVGDYPASEPTLAHGSPLAAASSLEDLEPLAVRLPGVEDEEQL